MGKKIKRSELNRIIKEETQSYFLEKRVEQKLVQEGFLDKIKGRLTPKSAMEKLIKATGDYKSPFFIDKNTGTLMTKPEVAFEKSPENLFGALRDYSRATQKLIKNNIELINNIPKKYRETLDSLSFVGRKNKDIFDKYSETDSDGIDFDLEREIRKANPPPQILHLIKGYKAWREGEAEAYQKSIELERELQDKIKQRKAANRREKEAEDRRQRDHEDKLAREKDSEDRWWRAKKRRDREEADSNPNKKYSRDDFGGGTS